MLSARKLAGLLGLSPEIDLERRLLNWARWKLGVSDLAMLHQLERFSGGFGFGGECGRRYRETSMPTLSGEAMETDAIIARLPQPERDAIHGHYLGALPNGTRMPPCWTQGDLAIRLGYALRTFERLLADARKAIASLLVARRTQTSTASAISLTRLAESL